MKEIIKITDENNNILNDRAEEIDMRKENALMREIILELKDTLRNHKEGVGLAAPQIGYNKRIFVINFSGITSDTKPSQFLNAFSCNSVTLDGKNTNDKLVQFSNAETPIWVTVLGIVISESLVQL